MNARSLLLSLIFGVVTTIAALLCTWFTIHSSAFARMVQNTLDEETIPGVIAIESLEWGPRYDQVTVYGLELRGRSGDTILDAARARVDLDLDVLHAEKRNLQLVVNRVEVNDFELTLEWGRHGKLGLADVFRNRAMGLDDEVAPPKKLLIDLQDIRLRNGRLHLVWPKFGFSFDHIDTDGKVHVTVGQLAIDVLALDCATGTAWVRGAPSWLSQAIGTYMPLNELAARAPEGLRIPFQGLEIRRFVWSENGFDTDLKLNGSGEVPIWVRGSMYFDRGITHELKLELGLSEGLAASLSHNVLSGPTTLRLSTKGRNLSSQVTLGPMTIPRINLGKLSLEKVGLEQIAIDTSREKAAVDLKVSAAKVAAGKSSMSDVVVHSRAELGYPGWNLPDFIRSINPAPTSVVGWLKALPPTRTRVILEVPTLKVGLFQRAKLQIREPRVQGLRVAVEPDGLTPKVSASVGEMGSRSMKRITLGLRTVVSMFPPSVVFELTLGLQEVSVAVLRRLVGDHEALTGRTGTIDGKLVGFIDPRADEVWRVEKIIITTPKQPSPTELLSPGPPP